MCDLSPMIAQWEGFHQQEVRLHHSRDIYQSLRRWGMGIAPWHHLPAELGCTMVAPLPAAAFGVASEPLLRAVVAELLGGWTSPYIV
jgi:hypothetical protein